MEFTFQNIGLAKKFIRVFPEHGETQTNILANPVGFGGNKSEIRGGGSK